MVIEILSVITLGLVVLATPALGLLAFEYSRQHDANWEHFHSN